MEWIVLGLFNLSVYLFLFNILISKGDFAYLEIKVDYLFSEECCDTLTIYDGVSQTSPVLSELSGSAKANVWTSSLNALIRFTSDFSNTGYINSYFHDTTDEDSTFNTQLQTRGEFPFFQMSLILQVVQSMKKKRMNICS